MAAGLQCWDAAGVEVFNSLSSTLRHLGDYTFPVSTISGQIYFQGMTPKHLVTGFGVDSIGRNLMIAATTEVGSFRYFTGVAMSSINVSIFYRS